MKSKKKVFRYPDDLFYTEDTGEEEKKVFTSSDDLFSTENAVKSKKKGLHVVRGPIHFSVIAGGLHKMVLRAICCPPLLQPVKCEIHI